MVQWVVTFSSKYAGDGDAGDATMYGVSSSTFAPLR